MQTERGIGVSNLIRTAATYARLMEVALRDKVPPGTCLPFLDDVLCHTGTLEQHFVALRALLEAHRQAGLRLQPQKCVFFQDSCEYLGHVVSKEGTRPMPSLIDIIQKWPTPTNRYEVD